MARQVEEDHFDRIVTAIQQEGQASVLAVHAGSLDSAEEVLREAARVLGIEAGDFDISRSDEWVTLVCRDREHSKADSGEA